MNLNQNIVQDAYQIVRDYQLNLLKPEIRKAVTKNQCPVIGSIVGDMKMAIDEHNSLYFYPEKSESGYLHLPAVIKSLRELGIPRAFIYFSYIKNSRKVRLFTDR